MVDCTELKCARIRRKKSTSEMAELIGKSDSAWNQRERGDTAISLEESGIVSRALELTEGEFIAIFYDGKLPFRKNGDNQCDSSSENDDNSRDSV